MLVCLGHACRLACFCPVVVGVGVPIGPAMTRTFIVIILLERAFLCGTSAIVLCVLPAVSMGNVVEEWSDAASQRKRKNEVQWANASPKKQGDTRQSLFWEGTTQNTEKKKKRAATAHQFLLVSVAHILFHLSLPITIIT